MRVNTFTPKKMAVALLLACGLSAQAWADPQTKPNDQIPCKDERANYDTTTGMLTIPFVNGQIITDPDGKLTGQIGIFSANFKQMVGVDEFQLLPDSFKYLNVAPKMGPDGLHPCYATYRYVDVDNGRVIDKSGGILEVPYLQVPTKVLAPGAGYLSGPINVYSVTFRHLAKDKQVLQLIKYDHLFTIQN